MNKIILCLLAIFICSLSLTIKAQDSTRTLLWKIEKEGLKTSYLYGTMHVKDERVFNFQDSLLPIIERTEAFAMEIHPDSLSQYLFNFAIDKKIKQIMEVEEFEEFEENKDIKYLLGNDEYKKLNKKFTKDFGISLDGIKNRNPYLIQRTLGQSLDSEKERPVFLDLHLYKLAKSNGMSVHGLESVSGNIDLYQKRNDIKIIRDLRTLLRITSNKELGELLLELYTDANLQALDSLYNDTIFVDKDYVDEVIIKRNYVMLNSMDSLAKLNSTFVAVGAAHLPGSEGLINLLIEKGYKVTPVLSPKTGFHKDFKLTVKPIELESFIVDNVGYKFKLPIKPFPIKIPYAQNDLYMGIDMATGIVYLSMGTMIAVEAVGKNEKSTMKTFIDNYRDNIKMGILESNEIDINGCYCREVTFGFLKPMAKLRFYIRDNKYFYLLGVTGEDIKVLDQEEINNFFESFEIIPIESEKWSLFTSTEGAFSIKFPGEPVKRNYTYYENTDDELKSNIFIASDNSTGLTYVVNYFDINSGANFLTDSAYLSSIINGTVAEMNVVDPEIKEVTNYGFPAYSTTVHNSKIYSKIFVCLRGNRIYLIVSQVPDIGSYPDFDTFFESFKLNNYSEIEWRDYKNTEYRFELKLPQLPDKEIKKEDANNYYYEANQKYNSILESIDIYSGNDYYVNIDEYSQFHEENDTSYFDFLTRQYIGYEDSLVYLDTIWTDNRKGFDMLIINENSHKRKRTRVFLDENKLYALSVFFPKGLEDSIRITTFFDSFHFTEPYKTSSIFSDKSKLIIDSLCSTDSTVHSDALRALDIYQYDSTIVNYMLSALNKEYSDDTSSGETRLAMLEVLSSLSDEKITEYLIINYKSLPDNPSLKLKALKALKNQKTEASAMKMVKFLLDDPPYPKSSYLTYPITAGLSDSIELFLPYAPSLLTLLNDSIYESFITQLAVLYIDSNLVHKQMLQPYTQTVIENFKREEEVRRINENTGDFYYGYWQQGFRLQYLSHFELDNNFLDELKEIVKNKKSNNPIVIPAIIVLLNNKIKVPKDVFQRIAEDPINTINLYDELKKNNYEHLFPKKLLNQRHFAEAEITAYIEEEDEYPDKMEFIKKLTITENEKDYDVYLFRMYYSWEEGNESYIAYAGKYESNAGQILYNGDITGTSYQVYDKKKEDEQLYEYIKELEKATRDYDSIMKLNTPKLKKLKKKQNIIEDEANLKPFVSYYDDGKIKESGTNLDGKKFKHWYVYEESGTIKAQYYYSKGNEEVIYLKSNIETLEQNLASISDSVEIIAAAQGCETTQNNEKSLECTNLKLQEWLNERINLTKTDLFEINEPIVTLQLIISDEGKINNIEILKGANDKTREKIIWSMQKFPPFEAAENANIKVGSKLTLFIDCREFFKMESSNDYVLSIVPYKNKHYTKGKLLLQNGKYLEAVETLTKALKKNPDNGHIYGKRGQAYFMLFLNNQALSDLNICLKVVKNNMEFYLLRASVLASMHRYKDALKDCDIAIDLSSDNYFALSVRASIKIELMDYEGALVDINEAIEMQAYELNLYLIRTRLYSHTRQFDKALDDLNTIIKIDSTLLAAYGSRAIINGILLDNYKEAITDLERIQKYATDSIDMITTNNNFGMVYSNMGEYDKAIEYSNKLINDEDYKHLAYNNRGYAKFKKGDIENALIDINKSLEINNKNCYAYRNKALILIAKEDYKNACIAIESSLRYGFTETYGDEMEKLKAKHCSQ